MQISNRGINLIAGFEGFIGCPYWDSYGGVWTRGFGETSGTGEFIGPGSRCISRQEGLNRLRSIFEAHYAPSINNLGVPLNQNQFDALASFVWNLGGGSMQWNVGQSLRERKYYQAANQMLAYDRAGGVVLSGLVTRRREEYNLFLSESAPPPPPPKPKPHNPLDVLFKPERNAVNVYNKYMKHPNWHRGRLAQLKRQMTVFRKDIYTAAVHGRLWSNPHKHVKAGWNINHRYQRYEILKKLTK